MKKELLAPAGDMECLKAAIHNGADAIYLAGKSFGARKFAKNFTNEELEEAIKYAHIYDVKIYVTVNTIIYEDEISDCLNYVCFLYNIGVDAVIVQDIGLITLIRKYLPDLEIHASTQSHTHNLEQIKLLENLGVKRVVLAREMNLKVINSLDTDMELEIFIHGALCISYSGQCLFSSCVLNRSGNRGECAGLCRVPYNLIENGKTITKDKYLLSPKEFNTTNYIEELKKSKAYSFKIEGRMKSPEYVGYVTHIYRQLLDNENYKLSDEEIFNLKSLYNRGFTKGYLFSNSDKEFISLNSSNHQGVAIGDVIEVTKDKIKIRLSHDLYQGDAIRLPNNEGMYVNFLYNAKMLLINQGNKGDIIYIDNKVNLKELGKISLTINKKLKDELESIPNKKVLINCEIEALANKPLVICYMDKQNVVEYIGKKVEPAKNMPLTKERVIEVLSKLGNTPFKLDKIDLKMDDNIFIPIGVLNEIRRNLIEELINKKANVNKNVKIELNDVNKYKRNVKDLKISALARTEEQIKTLLDLDIDYIYVTDANLYQKYKRKNIYLRLDRVLNNHPEYHNENLLIGETGSLKYTKNNHVITDYYLNVVNSAYVKFLSDHNVKRITLSPELTIERIKLLTPNIDSDVELEMILYGKIEYMIMKYNFIQNMHLDSKNKYELEDKNRRRYPIFNDNNTHLMSHQNLNILDDINKYLDLGISTFRIELFNESMQEIKEIIEKIRKSL